MLIVVAVAAPNTGVTSVGELESTVDPVPVDDVVPVPPLATATGVDNAIVPDDVIVPPVKPVPAATLVTVPEPAQDWNVGSDETPLLVKQVPAVLGSARFGAVVPLPTRTPWSVKDVEPVPPLATLTGVESAIVPLDVIGPPVRPVPVLTCVMVPTPPVEPHVTSALAPCDLRT